MQPIGMLRHAPCTSSADFSQTPDCMPWFINSTKTSMTRHVRLAFNGCRVAPTTPSIDGDIIGLLEGLRLCLVTSRKGICEGNGNGSSSIFSNCKIHSKVSVQPCGVWVLWFHESDNMQTLIGCVKLQIRTTGFLEIELHETVLISIISSRSSDLGQIFAWCVSSFNNCHHLQSLQ